MVVKTDSNFGTWLLITLSEMLCSACQGMVMNEVKIHFWSRHLGECYRGMRIKQRLGALQRCSPHGQASEARASAREDGGVSGVSSSCGARGGFLPRHDEDLREPLVPKSPPTRRVPPRGTPRVPAPLPLSPFSPPHRDRRGDSPAWSGRGSRPSQILVVPREKTSTGAAARGNP